MQPVSGWSRRTVVLVLAALALLAVVIAWNAFRPRGPVLLEFCIRQNVEMARLSEFGECAQFAIWLEDPASHSFRTVVVTRRSATGDWDGKAECPSALPRWFEVYRKETGCAGLPTPDAPAPDAVTAATPEVAHFYWRIEAPYGSRWICWIEVNLAADFNETFRQYNEETGDEDTHMSGQPSLLYRAEIEAVPGRSVVPAPWGRSVPDTLSGETVHALDGITTARRIFESVEIHVLRPPTVGGRRDQASAN